MANVTEISDSLIEIVNTMEPDGNINSKMKHLIENELIRRLSKYEVTSPLGRGLLLTIPRERLRFSLPKCQYSITPNVQLICNVA